MPASLTVNGSSAEEAMARLGLTDEERAHELMKVALRTPRPFR